MRTFATLSLLLVLATQSEALSYQASGQFQFTVDLPSGSETYAGSFETDLFTGPETGFIPVVIPLTSFTMTPNTVGPTVFDISNVAAEIYFSDGVPLDFIFFGGTITNPPGTTGGLPNDDFFVSFAEGSASSARVVIETNSGTTFLATNVSGSSTLKVIPEPATSTLLFAASAMLLRRRRI